MSRYSRSYEGHVYPENPSGNGQIDLIINHTNQTYGLEEKSLTNQQDYKKAQTQAAQNGQTLGLEVIRQVIFVAEIDEANRRKYEVDHVDGETRVREKPVYIEIGA